MGLEFLDLILHGEKKPGCVVLTDIDQTKLERAAVLFPVSQAAELGIKLDHLNVNNIDAVKELMILSGNKGYDDVFVMIPSAVVVEQASKILGSGGCSTLLLQDPPIKILLPHLIFIMCITRAII